jgi:predicted ATP-dependent endonuclease of OLD family
VRISQIKINNFANFSEFEIETSDNLVVVGENKVGKSNLVFALQLSIQGWPNATVNWDLNISGMA